jgi:stearoyl-CoA desaturase (delta-9 desaturase)
MAQLQILRGIWLTSHILTFISFFVAPAYMLIYGLAISLFFHVIGQGVSLHRYFAHRSFKVSKITEKFLAFVSIPCALGSPLSWVALHRHHHKTSDTKDDQQSPHHNSFLSIWFCTYLGQNPKGFRLIRDLTNKPLQIWIHKNYIYLLLSWAFAILLTAGPIGFITLFCIPVTFIYTATMLGSIFVHKWGYRNHNTSDHSVNSILVSIITLGDGWHNNHHADWSKYKHGERWFEFDLQAFIIKLIKI